MFVGNIRHRVDADGDVIMQDRLQQGRVRRMGDRNRHLQLELPQHLDLGPPRRVGVIALGLFHRVEQDNGFAPMEIE